MKYVNATAVLPAALVDEVVKRLGTNQIIRFGRIGNTLNATEAKLGHELVRRVRRTLGLQFKGRPVYFSAGRAESRVRQGRPPVLVNQQALYLLGEGWPLDFVCGAVGVGRASARALRRRLMLGNAVPQSSDREFSEEMVRELTARLTPADLVSTLSLLLQREGVAPSGDLTSDMMQLASSRYAGLETEAADLATKTLVEMCACARARLTAVGWVPPHRMHKETQ